MITKKSWGLLLSLLLVFTTSGAFSAVPATVNFQGKLTDAAGQHLDGSYTMEFGLCDHPDVGFGSCPWSETQSVTVVNGIYDVELGSSTLFPAGVFDALPLYIEVGIRTVPSDPTSLELMEPRLPLTSTPFAKHAAYADEANETDPTVPASVKDGTSWNEVSSKPAGFADNIDNVGLTTETDPTVTASVKDGVSWSEVASKPAGFADNIDDVGVTTETDPTVIASVKDGVSWSEVTSKPAGFADNVDNVGLTSETDPQVGGNTTNYVPKWNGSSLVTGSIFDNGNIGIGTTTPGQKLTLGSGDAENFNYLEINSGTWGGVLFHGGGRGGSLMYRHDTNALYLGTSPGDGTGPYDRLHITNTGMVGIGTTSPSKRLEVAGGVALGTGGQNAIWLGNIEGLTNADVRVARQGYAYTFAVGNTSDNYFAVKNTGDSFFNYNLGIGTTSPSKDLHIVGSMMVEEAGGADVFDISSSVVRLGGTTGGNDVDLRIMDTSIDDEVFNFNSSLATLYLGSGNSTTTGDSAELFLINSDGRTGAWLYSYGSLYLGYGSSSSTGGDGDIYIRNNTGSNTIILDGDTGRVTAERFQLTGGADISEHFDISATRDRMEPLPGFLVSIDAENPGDLLVSRTAYDRTVAGIVSGANGINPGFTLVQEGTETEGQFPVALSGRVYAWADASQHSIVPGDLLTTSEIPGHAMKVTDHTLANGSVIGKAMSSLDEGKGLVLVLVSLQ